MEIEFDPAKDALNLLESPAPKIHIGFRLWADIVQAVRASGKGYKARVEKVLREALAKGQL